MDRRTCIKILNELLEYTKSAFKYEKNDFFKNAFADIESAISNGNIGGTKGSFALICNAYSRTKDYKSTCQYIEGILRKIDDYEECVTLNLVKETDSPPIIFLSHSSKDLAYANPLRDFISALGIEDDSIIYTSHPNHNIPYGENIYEYLAKKIRKNCVMVNLWSENYFDSLACICETGAAWVLGCDYEKICIPPLRFNDSRFSQTPIDINKIGVMLDGSKMCKKLMMEFGKKLISVFNLPNQNRIDTPLTQFMAEIIRLGKERQKIIESERNALAEKKKAFEKKGKDVFPDIYNYITPGSLSPPILTHLGNISLSSEPSIMSYLPSSNTTDPLLTPPYPLIPPTNVL